MKPIVHIWTRNELARLPARSLFNRQGRCTTVKERLLDMEKVSTAGAADDCASVLESPKHKTTKRTHGVSAGRSTA
ncbi:hypothetical protein EVAR_60120_1 [Eumeta japonica]|uniref:Uncharacterized protein n=1 Tax=Eumeta variegata TaxID=151549 RepID=A0A4C1ZQF7_EUMVA|nr:hypothetical protein EVAR_60120_1 [Eumeta japonica]